MSSFFNFGFRWKYRNSNIEPIQLAIITSNWFDYYLNFIISINSSDDDQTEQIEEVGIKLKNAAHRVIFFTFVGEV